MKITTEQIYTPTHEIAIEIGLLMPDLSDRHDSSPVSLDNLKKLTKDPNKAIIVARYNNKIVGCAVLNLIVTLHEPKAWLEDFVVSSSEEIRGKGAGFAMWEEITSWVIKHNATLEFTSSKQRVDAHKFYKRQGAKIKDTCVFLFEPN